MVKQLYSTMSEVLNDHKTTYDEDSMRNLTDVYLKQIKESNDPSFNGNILFSVTHVFIIIQNYISIHPLFAICFIFLPTYNF